MKAKVQTALKASLMISLAGFLMGNESCENKDARKGRELKKLVQLGRLAAPSIQIPGGASFDFGFVANQQIYGVMMESQGFTMRYTPPILPNSSGGSTLNLNGGDMGMFKAMMKGQNAFSNWSKEASCMVNLPMAKIWGSVNSFEMVGGGGLRIGFTPAGSHVVSNIGGSFNVDFAQMDLSLLATRPLTNKVIQAVNVTSNQTKTNLNFNISFGMFSIGPSFWYQTPLARVTKTGLQKGVENLRQALQSEPWSTRVLAGHDNFLTIIGGRDVNLKEGDELAVYNEIYHWYGEPCASEYIGGAATNAVAKIRITSVGDEISFGQVFDQTDENAVIGAKVMVHKLVPDAPATKAPATKLAQKGL